MGNVGRMVYDAVRRGMQARDGGPGSGPRKGGGRMTSGATSHNEVVQRMNEESRSSKLKERGGDPHEQATKELNARSRQSRENKSGGWKK